MLAREIVEKVARDLGDLESGHEYVHWPQADLLGFVSDAQRVVVLLRPDANSVTVPAELAEGSTKQTIPADGARFLGIVRNMGDDGQTPGLPVTPVSMDDLNAAASSWHEAAFSAVIDHYVFDDAVPRVFWVTPPPADSVWVDLSYSRTPELVADMDLALPLDDVWGEPLREYVMYRAYARNDASDADMAKAERHLSRFYLLLGEEAKAKLAFSPNNSREVLTG